MLQLQLHSMQARHATECGQPYGILDAKASDDPKVIEAFCQQDAGIAAKARVDQPLSHMNALDIMFFFIVIREAEEFSLHTPLPALAAGFTQLCNLVTLHACNTNGYGGAAQAAPMYMTTQTPT